MPNKWRAEGGCGGSRHPLGMSIKGVHPVKEFTLKDNNYGGAVGASIKELAPGIPKPLHPIEVD